VKAILFQPFSFGYLLFLYAVIFQYNIAAVTENKITAKLITVPDKILAE